MLKRGREKMAIATKSGDRGMTSLCWGAKTRKDALRVEVCGTIDELTSFLGLAKTLVHGKKNKGALAEVQEDLFTIASEAATLPKFASRLKARVNKKCLSRLERYLEKNEKKAIAGKNRFSLPGKNKASASLDLARTVTRRLERRAVTLWRRGGLKNGYILSYLNRLSDFLYLLARSLEKS